MEFIFQSKYKISFSAFIGIDNSRKFQIMYLYMFASVFIFIFILLYLLFFFFSQRLEIFNNAPPPPHDFAFRYSVLLAGRKLVTSAWLAGYLDECL